MMQPTPWSSTIQKNVFRRLKDAKFDDTCCRPGVISHYGGFNDPKSKLNDPGIVVKDTFWNRIVRGIDEWLREKAKRG